MPFAVSAGRYIVAFVSMRFIVRFPIPKNLNCVYSGSEITCVGTSIIMITIPKSSPLPLNLNGKFYLYDSERHITEEGVKSTSLKPFPAGTVILSTRAPIGKTAIAGCEMYCNQGFKNFVCDNTINPVYLFYSLRIHNPELQKMGTGSTFLELSKKAIEQISISVPPKELQDEFEQFYKQADKSKYLS